MNKIIIAMDSFKGSMRSQEAGEAVKRAAEQIYPDSEIKVYPMADGGEGTVEALTFAKQQIESVTCTVTGPAGTLTQAEYIVYGKGEQRTAVLEMAQAAGLMLVSDDQRNPMKTTTYGVGEMIRNAVERGCRRFIIGIGGSATNDGGIGMLQALGYGFLDKDGNNVPFGARGLEVLDQITDQNVLPELSECEFKIACDVTNILCGENGCSAVYGPQKGADTEMIQSMDQWLGAYASLAGELYEKAVPNQPGTGAAGGMGFAFLTFTNAVLESGISIVLEETELEKYIRDADIVITGEGRLDGQTAMGKAPIAVARLAKKYGKPVFAFSGCVTPDAIQCNDAGIDAFFPILRSICSLEEAMEPASARKNLSDTVEQVMRVVRRFS